MYASENVNGTLPVVVDELPKLLACMPLLSMSLRNNLPLQVFLLKQTLLWIFLCYIVLDVNLINISSTEIVTFVNCAQSHQRAEYSHVRLCLPYQQESLWTCREHYAVDHDLGSWYFAALVHSGQMTLMYLQCQ